MNSEEICKMVAQDIRDAHFNAGEYSGFSHNGIVNIEKSLQWLVDAIKREILQEIKGGE